MTSVENHSPRTPGPLGFSGDSTRQSPRQVCEWCGKSVTHFRRLPEGGYECSREQYCGKQRFNPLSRMGVAAVLQAVVEHGWNITRAAKSLGVSSQAVEKYLNKYAPDEMAEARRSGLVSRGSHRRTGPLNDPDVIRAALGRYHNRKQAAKALGVDTRTLRRAMARLIPGEVAA